MSTEADNQLLAQKTAEYDNLPGLVLGLDGWILRSIPKDQRETFLKGFEKIIRVVMHPDRARTDAQRKTRENYLQSVSEAVRFMLSDEFSYDMTADSVPSKKNPLVTLKHEIVRREEIIERVSSRADEHRDVLKAVQAEARELRERLGITIDDFEEKLSRSYWLRHAIVSTVRHWAIPIRLKQYKINCRPILWHYPKNGSNFIDAILECSKTGNYADHRKLTDAWIEVATKHLSSPISLAFKNGLCRSGGCEIQIKGAFTSVHFFEFTRKLFPGINSGKELSDALNDLTSNPLAAGKYDEMEKAFRTLLMPFFSNGMIVLLTQKPTSGNIRLTPLFYHIESSDVGSNIAAHLSAIKDQMVQEKIDRDRAIIDENHKLTLEIKRLKKDAAELRKKLRVTTKDVPT